VDHASGLVFRRPPAALPRRAVVHFYAAVHTAQQRLISGPSPDDAFDQL
jgi:hypothetical protein